MNEPIEAGETREASRAGQWSCEKALKNGGYSLE